MLSDRPSLPIEADEALTCPNCQALNQPRAMICLGCGVNLGKFQIAQERLDEALGEERVAHLQELSSEAAKALATGVATGRVQTKRLLNVLLLTSVVLAVVVAVAAAFYGHHQKLRRERLAREYQEALTCLSMGDYVCARDSFLAVQCMDPDYQNADAYLREARFQLARQLTDQAEWIAAEAELDELLTDSADDARSRALRTELYNRWLGSALARGDLLTAIQVLMRRSVR